MKVKAISMGFYRGARVRPGEVFDLAPDDKPGKWMADPETGRPLVAGVMIRDSKRVMNTVIRDRNQVNTFSEMTRMSNQSTVAGPVEKKVDGRTVAGRALKAAAETPPKQP